MVGFDFRYVMEHLLLFFNVDLGRQHAYLAILVLDVTNEIQCVNDLCFCGRLLKRECRTHTKRLMYRTKRYSTSGQDLVVVFNDGYIIFGMSLLLFLTI